MRKIVIPGKAGVQTDITDQVDRILLISKVGNRGTLENGRFLANLRRKLAVASGPRAPGAVLEYLSGRIGQELHAHLSGAWTAPTRRKRSAGTQETHP